MQQSAAFGLSVEMPRKTSKPTQLNMFYGYSVEQVAAWCCVSLQTARKYKANQLKPSSQSIALFRIYTNKKFIPDSWEGWRFHDGKLYDPEDVPLTLAQLRAYQFVFQLAMSRAPEETFDILKNIQESA